MSDEVTTEGPQRYVHDKRNDPRSTEELISLALTVEDEAEAWEAVMVLHFRATREVFEAARRLCKSENVRERQLGADILGQLGVPERAFPDESVTTLLELLRTEQDAQVLSSACVALGHLRDARAIESLINLKNHPSEDVRHGVVLGLSGHRDERAIAALIELSGDFDSHVRDWATFELGSILEDVDTPELREALYARVEDPDGDTRAEALVGLAKRKDERAIKPLIEWLEQLGTDAGNMLYEAATELADPRLCIVLLKLKVMGVEDMNLEEALNSCGCVGQEGEGE